jgi:hypothetical protein
MKARREADELVKVLVQAIRDRQEARGDDHRDAVAYTLGYLSSVLAGVVANSPKGRKYLKDTLQFVKENA